MKFSVKKIAIILLAFIIWFFIAYQFTEFLGVGYPIGIFCSPNQVLDIYIAECVTKSEYLINHSILTLRNPGVWILSAVYWPVIYFVFFRRKNKS